MTPKEGAVKAVRTHWCQLGIESGFDVCRRNWDGIRIDRLENHDSESHAWDRVAELNARAVIAALREPSEMMITKMSTGRVERPSGFKDHRRTRAAEWRAGIDAALAEGET